MTTYEQLSDKDKGLAYRRALESVLNKLTSGELCFNDTLNKDDLQARIDKALERAEKMRTPWFAHEYVLETCRDEVEGLAQAEAEDALYVDKGEHYVNLH